MNAVSQSSPCVVGGIRIRSWKQRRNTRCGVRVIVHRSLFVLSVSLAAVCVHAPAWAGCPQQGAADAALVLSEVARTDRVEPWVRDDERVALVERAAKYLESVDDYHGYNADIGWRHGVAHGADWAMQLALNPALGREQLDRLLHAVAVQAVPASGHAYVFGESERLARTLLFIAKRDLHSEAEWTAWFTALSTRLGDPALAWKDEAWLARRHDLAAFLNVLYVETDLSEDPGIARMKPGVLAALKALP